MTDAAAVSWPALLALGAGHGINPAMGWLFAVALGLQRGSRRAVWARAGTTRGWATPRPSRPRSSPRAWRGWCSRRDALRWSRAALLVGLGVYRLVRARHITYGGMRANAPRARRLVVPHGVGSRRGADGAAARARSRRHGLVTVERTGLLAALVHSAGYLLMTGAIAVLVYERIGLGFLRRGGSTSISSGPWRS